MPAGPISEPPSKITTVGKIAFVGNYMPRQCGIATFTTDLCQAVTQAFPRSSCVALAVNDRPEGYAYPDPVRFEIREGEIESYQRAADYLNLNNYELVCVQHEFGIYGGKCGSHLLEMLRELRMPVVATLHTVLLEPDRHQRRVMEQLIARCDRLVVMTERAREILLETHEIPTEKIDLIPHGIPDVAFVDSGFYKDEFGLEGRQVLLTFGLLSPNKGIETVIDALPAVLEKHPDVVYVVLGATHPHLLRSEGEAYRLSLQRLAEARGVQRNVIFYNRFVELKELMEFIGAADIYITPYLNEAQITSGTLAYAFGAGKAVISTPYWHAQEMLADGRGILVPFGDSGAIAAGIMEYLGNEAHRLSIRRNAYKLSRKMTWPSVAKRYMKTFQEARAGRKIASRKSFAAKTLDARPHQLPPLKLDHLVVLTDSTGLLQHAAHTVPRYADGYCVDDNARAFILTTLMGETGESPERIDLASKYLAFIWEAFDRDSLRFRNFMTYDRRWLEPVGSEDSHARTVWALGTALGRSPVEGFRSAAGELFQLALPQVERFVSPRAWAFALLGIHEYLRRFSGDRSANTLRITLTDKLMALHKQVATEEWPWFEEYLTYDNPKLCHALILSGHWTQRPEVLEMGLTSLRWLAALQVSASGCFSPIGSDGFHSRGGPRANFDQQPLEAHSMVSACLEAQRVTNDPAWGDEARRAFEWFLGRNDLSLPLYDHSTGGCRDALHADRVNLNEGAESTLAFLLSLCEMRLARNSISAFEQDLD